MRDLHRRHTSCPYQKRRSQTGFPYACPGNPKHFFCFRQIGGFGLNFDFRPRGCPLYLSDYWVAQQNRVESNFLCLGNRLGPRSFSLHRRGCDSLFEPFLRARVGHFCLNSKEDYCHFPR